MSELFEEILNDHDIQLNKILYILPKNKRINVMTLASKKDESKEIILYHINEKIEDYNNEGFMLFQYSKPYQIHMKRKNSNVNFEIKKINGLYTLFLNSYPIYIHKNVSNHLFLDNRYRPYLYDGSILEEIDDEEIINKFNSSQEKKTNISNPFIYNEVESTEQDTIEEENTIEDSNHEESNVEESYVEESNIEESNVEESNVEESNVEETNIEESNIEESNIEESNIEESNIKESNIEESNIEESNIEESNVEDINIESNVENSHVELNIENNVSEMEKDIKLDEFKDTNIEDHLMTRERDSVQLDGEERDESPSKEMEYSSNENIEINPFDSLKKVTFKIGEESTSITTLNDTKHNNLKEMADTMQKIEEERNELTEMKNLKRMKESRNFNKILEDYNRLQTETNYANEEGTLELENKIVNSQQKIEMVKLLNFNYMNKTYSIMGIKVLKSENLNFQNIFSNPIHPQNLIVKNNIAIQFDKDNNYYLINLMKTKYLICKNNNTLIITNVSNRNTKIVKNKDIFKLNNQDYYLTHFATLLVPMENKKMFDNYYGTMFHQLQPRI